ncbi:MAG: tetratricopeptide repeat protein [Candidatus Pacebacteria bacterium]|nr:tetratricopeptide repeat protein [Candidatus Paceibacterota bacterium]
MNEFIKEVEQEIRADRYEELWKKYGKWLIAALVLVVLGTAGFVAWRNYRYEQNATQGAELIGALNLMDRGDLAGATAALNHLAKNGRPSYAALAELHEAQAQFALGKTSQALGIYSTIAENSSYDPIFRDLALLLSGYIWVGLENPELLEARLKPIMAKDNPWHFGAIELLALSQMNGKNYAKAREILTPLSQDSAAPAGIKRRAGELLSTLPAVNG